MRGLFSFGVEEVTAARPVLKRAGMVEKRNKCADFL